MHKILFATLLIISSISNSQITLFQSMGAPPNIDPPNTVFSIIKIDVDLEGLRTFPDSIQINFPDGTSTTLSKLRFYPRRGYLFFDDELDPPGTPPFWVDPSATDNDFSYMWSGSNSEYQAIFTMTRGILVGYITGMTKRYGIKKQPNDDYWLLDYNLAAFQPDDPDLSKFVVNSDVPSNKADVFKEAKITNHKVFNSTNYSISSKSNNTVLDLLILWTEEARIEAGGASGDPNDTEDIEAEIGMAVDHTNETFINSEMNSRVTQFHTAKLTNVTFNVGFATALRNFRNSSVIQQFRN